MVFNIGQWVGFAAITARRRRRHLRLTFVDPAVELAKIGRFDRAHAILERGLAAYPKNPDLLFASAGVAQQERRLDRVIDVCQTAIEAAPDRPPTYLMLSAAFRATSQSDRAFAVMTEAQRRFPDDVTVRAEFARVAENRGEFEDALQCWNIVCAAPNPHAEWLQRRAHILLLLHRFEEAEQVLDAALAPYRTDEDLREVLGLLAVRGAIAAGRHDWSGAVAFWSDFRRRFPDSPIGWNQLGRAQYNYALSRADAITVTRQRAAPESAEPIEVGFVADEDKKALLLGFESLGDSCEFGLVQRRYGAEPLGLFRWNAVAVQDLIAGLDQSFAGLGDLANTQLVAGDDGGYIVRDPLRGFTLYTLMRTGQVEHNAFHGQMCRRIEFLKTKLLADLAAAEKIFVYTSRSFDANDLQRLHIALKAHGPIKLLAVQPKAGEGTFEGVPGDVVWLAKDLCLGFIDRLGQAPHGAVNFAFDDWISICEKAMMMFSRGESVAIDGAG